MDHAVAGEPVIARRIGRGGVGADAKVAAVQRGRDGAGDGQVLERQLFGHRLVDAREEGVRAVVRKALAIVLGQDVDALGDGVADCGFDHACHDGLHASMFTTFTLRLEGNSVNMNPEPVRKNYHHGDLRAALIEAGLKLLAERDADDLGLREVAREVGVSATSVYRHFPDKNALLTALAGEGLTRLAVAQHAAAEAAGGGDAGFSATGAAYVRFALANPALFRLIFANPLVAKMLEEPPAGSPDAMAFLKANAAALADRRGVDARVVVARAWSIAHGLAMLMLDGQLPVDDALIDRVIDVNALA